MTITKEKIEIFVKNFYTNVNRDNLLSPIFNDVANVNWIEHTPKLVGFWSSILLKTGDYRGNAYKKHLLLAKQITIDESHFKQWLKLFKAQAVLDFEKEDAENIISKAENIAKSLKLGMFQHIHKH